jgi:hypothetical protein
MVATTSLLCPPIVVEGAQVAPSISSLQRSQRLFVVFLALDFRCVGNRCRRPAGKRRKESRNPYGIGGAALRGCHRRCRLGVCRACETQHGGYQNNTLQLHLVFSRTIQLGMSWNQFAKVLRLRIGRTGHLDFGRSGFVLGGGFCIRGFLDLLGWRGVQPVAFCHAAQSLAAMANGSSL